MTVCAPECTGHSGKFDDCLSEALFEVSLESFETTGDCDFEGTFTLVTFDSAEEYTLYDGRTVTIPAGFYIVHTAPSGFVTVYTYDTADEARAAYRQAEDAYCAWADD